MADWLEQNGTPEADWLAQNATPDTTALAGPISTTVQNRGLFGLVNSPTVEPMLGMPDVPGGMNPPWWGDPLNYVQGPAGSGAQAGAAGAALRSGVAGGAEALANPVARGLGGAALEAGMEMLPGPLRVGARGLMAMMGKGAAKEAASPAATAVARKLGIPLEQAATEIAKPLLGHEAQVFRSGGMAEVIRERLAKEAEGIAGSAASRVAPAVAAAAPEAAQAVAQTGAHVLAPEDAKVVLDASRRRGFAFLKQAGITSDAASRKFIGKVLGRKVASRAELGISDWIKVNAAAEEQALAKAAEEQVASKVAKTAARKVVAKPAAGAAASRVPAASEVPPGTLQRLSEMNLSPQELYDFWRQAAQ